MCEIIKRFLDVKVVSFISDENLSFWAMFALGRDVYISDDCCGLLCLLLHLVSLLTQVYL